MRAMKDSGIKWIGEIPEEWEVCRLKNIFNLKTGTTPKEYDSKSQSDEYIDWYTPSDIDDTRYILSDAQRKLAKEIIDKESINIYPNGSILFVGIGATAGKVGYIVSTGYSNQQITALIPKTCFSKFYFYLLYVSKEIIRDNAFFTTLPIINNGYLSQVLTVCPFLSEQHRIATYLDNKCGEIDELIGIQEKFIEELKAYKQSVITEAVTKGLNSNATLKDSGVEWIGEIPEEWEVCRLKAKCVILRGGSPRPIEDYISETGYNWIKIGDTTKGYKYIDKTSLKINESGLVKTRLVHKNDLILTNSMSFGNPYILNIDGCIHDGWVAFTEIRGLDKNYLYYLLLSSVCKNQFSLQVDGGVVQNLNVDKIGRTNVCVPPLSEQQSIATYLDNKCSQIDSLITLKQTKIDELKSFKKSLIYEYVTGKKTVPENV